MIRNLPWECTAEELIEFGKPFGKVINTKCNVGTNRNQAFIEFADTNQAMAMISYYSTATEPAQIRGKTVYLQYSNRGEITNSKTTGEVPSNVLLVTLEGVQTGDVSIDVLHPLDSLKAKESIVIRQRYGLDGKGERSVAEVAGNLNISRESVRKHTLEALMKLKHPTRLD